VVFTLEATKFKIGSTILCGKYLRIWSTKVDNKDEGYMVLANSKGKSWERRKLKHRLVHIVYGIIMRAIR